MILKGPSGEEIRNKFKNLDESEKILHFFWFLNRSVEADYVEGVKILLEQETDLNPVNIMIKASKDGSINIVKYLYEQGVSINEPGDSVTITSETMNGPVVSELTNGPICFAAKKGHYELVKFLIDKGADVHAHREYSLIHAIEGGYYDVVKLLLDAGADVSARDYGAFRLAIYEGYNEIYKLLETYRNYE